MADNKEPRNADGTDDSNVLQFRPDCLRGWEADEKILILTACGRKGESLYILGAKKVVSDLTVMVILIPLPLRSSLPLRHIFSRQSTDLDKFSHPYSSGNFLHFMFQARC